jgi:hypothetical protein
MRSWFYAVPIAAVVLAVFLGYREWMLERRVEALTRELGSTGADPTDIPPAAPERTVAGAAPSSDTLAKRLSALEAGLASVRADLRSLEKATSDLPQVVTDQQILSVMKDHGAKVMEKQLKYHRERWLEQRELALNDFSRRFNLSQRQSDQIWSLLSSEADKMVDILRNPESFEDPERAAKVWKQLLHDTDAGVHQVLDPQAAVAWDQARFIERKLLWPWLPD